MIEKKMSEEVDSDVSVVSSNNKNQVPLKKTNFMDSFT